MSLLEALKQNTGKRVVIVHSEGKQAHTIVGIIKDISDDIVSIVTDFGITSWVKIDTIIKIKEASKFVSDENDRKNI